MYFWDKHKTITSYYELLSGEVCDRYELTQMEYDILMFLHNNPQHNTAADIVKIRKSTKSHVSTSLKNLENKGLVERIQSKDNKKHIEIVLLDKAEVIVKAGINAQKQFAKDVLSGLTEEEKHMCIDVFDKICNRAELVMKQNNYKPQLPDVMEAIFDAAYLIFDLIAAILFFIYSNGDMLFILYGILTLTLCGGDAFHLVPRIIRAVCGSSDKIKKQLGIGLQISSITMTAFYIILMYIWKFTFPGFTIPVIIEVIIWISAIVRIVICMFPQNNWCTDEGNMKLSVIRNSVFAVTGIGVIILYLISGNAYGYHLTRMVAAIIISFGCYIPVTLFSKTKPKVGLLMIPKTCAYMWIIAMGLKLLF